MTTIYNDNLDGVGMFDSLRLAIAYLESNYAEDVAYTLVVLNDDGYSYTQYVWYQLLLVSH